jgi:DNA repair protein SbcD/Mre11
LKFLHAADVHLDSPLRGLRTKADAPIENIRTASRRALQNLVALAVKEAVDLVVIAGDLFDGDRDNYDTSLFFVKQAAKLKEAGIPLLLIWGNHDAQSKMLRTVTWPTNVKVLSADAAETRSAESLGIDAPIAVHGWSFATASEQRNLVAAYPKPISGCFNLGILHTSLTGAEGHDNYAPCTLDDLATRGYDYWALGHIHQRGWLPRSIEQGAAPVVFPGNLQGRHIKETGAKGCYLIEADASGVMKQTFHALDAFRWQTISIDSNRCDRFDDLASVFTHELESIHASADGRHCAIRVTLCGNGALFDSVVARPAKAEAEFNNIILQSFDEQIWLEALRFEPRAAPGVIEDPLSDAISEYLEREIKSLSNDAENEEFSQLFEDLVRKLPPELADEFDLQRGKLSSSPSWRNMVQEAETLLRARLREQPGAVPGAAR